MGKQARRRLRDQILENRRSYAAYRDAVRDMTEEKQDLFSLAVDSALNLARSKLTHGATHGR